MPGKDEISCSHRPSTPWLMACIICKKTSVTPQGDDDYVIEYHVLKSNTLSDVQCTRYQIPTFQMKEDNEKAFLS